MEYNIELTRLPTWWEQNWLWVAGGAVGAIVIVTITVITLIRKHGLKFRAKPLKVAVSIAQNVREFNGAIFEDLLSVQVSS
ncbi:MAG: hypothetical protein ACUVTD_06725 [Nitrososphaerales archaeon]